MRGFLSLILETDEFVKDIGEESAAVVVAGVEDEEELAMGNQYWRTR